MRRSLALPLVLASLLASPAALAAPYFSDATAQSLLTQPCGPGENTGCYTNFAVIADLDGDGSPDVLFANGGGYYTAADAQPAAVYLNDGKGALSDVSKASFGAPSSRLRQIAVGDIDGDGDLDVYMPGAYGVDLDRIFVQTAPKQFVDQAAVRLPKGLKSRAGAAHFGDVDDDGDLDLVVTDWGTSPLDSPGDVRLYLNDGKGRFSTAPQGSLPAPLMAQAGNTPIDVDLQDVNGDGHLDLLVDHRNGLSRLFLNDGKGHFTDAVFPPKQGPYVYNTEACDIDGDGDLDLLLDNAAGDLGSGHRTQILVNDGTGHFTDESAARVAGEPNTDDNAVKCADIDNDGDFDLIVASLANPSEKLLVNDGKGHFTAVMGAFPDANDPTLGLDVADLDGDGVLDVVTGQGEGSPWLNRVYRGQSPAQADTRPPVLRQVIVPDGVVAGQTTVIKLAVSDAHTSEVGQQVASVSVAYEAGATKGSAVARFVGGDLFRATIPPLPEGSQVTFTPTAVDLLGHSVTGQPATRTVAPGAGGAGGQAGSGGSAGGAAGDSGAAGEGGQAGSGGEPAGGAAGSGPGGSGPGGSGGAQAGSGGDAQGGAAGTGGAGGAAQGGASGGTGGLSAPGGAAGQTGGAAGSTAGAGGAAEQPAGDTGDDGGCSAGGPARPARGGSFGLAGLLALAVARVRRGTKAAWGARRGAGKRG
jgi:hypothetical protein